MSAKLRGFSFATRSSDAGDDPPAIQVLGSDQANASSRKKASGRVRTPESRLAALSRAQLTASGLLELVDPQRTPTDLIINSDNYQTLAEINEIRRGEELRRHGLSPRSRLLFCGPPGCGKTLCAEVLARELKLPLLIARLDEIISQYLGATASNLRKVFEAAAQLPAVLFLDEFDALSKPRLNKSYLPMKIFRPSTALTLL